MKRPAELLSRALRNSTGVRESSDKYATIEKLLSKEGVAEGASAAKQLLTSLSKGGPPSDVDEARSKLDKAIYDIATLQSAHAIPGFVGPHAFVVNGNVVVPQGDYASETDPRCPGGFQDSSKISSILSKISSVQSFQDYAGPVFDLAGNYVPPSLDSIQGRTLAELFWSAPIPQCRTVGVLIPKGSTSLQYRYKARELGGEDKPCSGPDLTCEVGWARWEVPAKVIETDSSILVVAVFKNWSHIRTREATLEVTFVPTNIWCGHFDTIFKEFFKDTMVARGRTHEPIYEHKD